MNLLGLMSFGLLAALAAPGAASAQTKPPAEVPAVLFENVRVFDGKGDRLSAPSNVLVVGNTIKSISTATIAAPAGTAMTRIAGGGRTLMPGPIDAHAHLMFATSVVPCSA